MAFNEAQLVLISLGIFLEMLATFLVVTGRGGESSGAKAFNRINLNLPAWAMVLVLGAVLISGSMAWNWSDSSFAPDPPSFDDTFDEEIFPFGYGDDAILDGYEDGCTDGVMDDCDLLFFESPSGSGYEDFGATCGYRLDFWDSGNCWSYVFD